MADTNTDSPAPRPAAIGTAAATMNGLARFCEDLDLADIASFPPLALDGWTVPDHIAAARWTGTGGFGTPPPKAREYLQALREHCGAPPVEVDE